MDARTRLGWIRLYEQIGNAGVVCRRCGIARPTLRKWWRRYQAALAELEKYSERELSELDITRADILRTAYAEGGVRREVQHPGVLW